MNDLRRETRGETIHRIMTDVIRGDNNANVAYIIKYIIQCHKHTCNA